MPVSGEQPTSVYSSQNQHHKQRSPWLVAWGLGRTHGCPKVKEYNATEDGPWHHHMGKQSPHASTESHFLKSLLKSSSQSQG
jgi:hypothetical protein